MSFNRWLNELTGKYLTRKRCFRPRRRRRSYRLGVELLESRILLNSSNPAFLGQTYRDLLHREADQPGLVAYNGLLAGGASRFQVVRAIESSPEYRVDEVEKNYQALLGRAADPGGLNAFATALGGVATPEQVTAAILSSREYFQRAGANNSSFLVSVYHDILDRPPEAKGAAAWHQLFAAVSFLPPDTQRLLVATGIVSSVEAHAHRVNGLYQRFLHRQVDPVGLQAYLGLEQHGLRDEDFIAAIIISPEYDNLLQNPTRPGPVDTQPPTIAILSPAAGLTTSHNVTVTGQVTDDQPGVSSLQAAVDSGPFGNVSVAASGNFSFTTALVLDGTADGSHTIHFQATDKAGNVSGISDFSLTLDTQAPTIKVQSPASGLPTNQNITVKGQVTDTLSGVASFLAQVDAGSPANVAFDNSSRFSFMTNLSLDGSADGSHVVHLRATDQAGNTSNPVDFSFTLDTRPPTVTIVSPTSGFVTNSNITVTGQVADSLSSVAVLQAQVDSGPSVNIAVGAAGNFSFATTLALDGSADGTHAVHLRATDTAGNTSNPVDVSFTLDTQSITLSIASPTAGLVTNHNVTVSGQVTANLANLATLQEQLDAGPFVDVAFDSAGKFSFTTTLPLDGTADGSHTVIVHAKTRTGAISPPVSVAFALDTRPPTLTLTSAASGFTTNRNATVTGQVTAASAAVPALQAQVDSGVITSVALDKSGNFSFTTNLPLDGSADGSHTVHLSATDQAGNVTRQDVAFTLDTLNPAASAAPLDQTVATTVGAATQFLYNDSNPAQTGVVPGTINSVRAAVIRGQVQTRDGSPLAGVTISILNHPEFGSTQTRRDGMFDMAVNGGGLLTVVYNKNGFLTVRRQLQVPWQDYVMVADVVLIRLDSQVTAIDLTASTPIQVARGSPMTDATGSRQATLLFPQGTHATMTLPDGTTRPLTTLHVRATEYSVGPNGPQAMPADLPPNSGYTYAVEFSADEAVAAGASGVSFDRPLSFYLEDFINLPVGGAVPVATFDRVQGKWLPLPNGRIIKILTVTNGMADLDVDGSGKAADAAALAALGITDAERQQVAGLYQPGKVLWRVPVAHFSPVDT